MSWFFKRDASSPALFEKALSKLSGQISSAALAVDTTRSRARRIKALWTLYTTLTYLLSLLILVLVIGPQEWSLPHYSGLVGGPVVIYAVRYTIVLAFGWRINRQQAYLEGLQQQRDSKINELKKATKYDSTQELLQKYGGGPPKETPTKQPSRNEKKGTQPSQQHARTGLPPPPTANIQLKPMDESPTLQKRPRPASPQTPISHPAFSPEEPGFAPNAFPLQSRQVDYERPSNWYDRILDVMLGEDETQAKNRLVLLCQDCRLVNGQAPPGVKTLEQLGRWRCASCGAWNGQENDAVGAAKQITRIENSKREDTELVTHEERDREIETLPEQEEHNTSTGAESEPGITKRVTRSAGEQPVEGL